MPQTVPPPLPLPQLMPPVPMPMPLPAAAAVAAAAAAGRPATSAFSAALPPHRRSTRPSSPGPLQLPLATMCTTPAMPLPHPHSGTSRRVKAGRKYDAHLRAPPQKTELHHRTLWPTAVASVDAVEATAVATTIRHSYRSHRTHCCRYRPLLSPPSSAASSSPSPPSQPACPLPPPSALPPRTTRAQHPPTTDCRRSAVPTAIIESQALPACRCALPAGRLKRLRDRCGRALLPVPPGTASELGGPVPPKANATQARPGLRAFRARFLRQN